MADTKQQWYKDAKYGLFIHWGLYSILAGEWKDPKTGEVTKTDRIAEWMRVFLQSLITKRRLMLLI